MHDGQKPRPRHGLPPLHGPPGLRYPERTVYGRIERRIARLRQLASQPDG